MYLADLAFAQTHDGKTCTGAPWQFYKFGPWSYDVLERIALAMDEVHADKTVYESQYREDEEWVRWSLYNEELKGRLEASLPWEVTTALRRVVRQFGPSTPELLDFVYNTSPMRHAAPEEALDFNTAIQAQPTQEAEPMPAISARKKKNLKAGMAALQAKAAALRERRRRHPGPQPRYDNIYYDGLAWLDSLAGEPLPVDTQDAVFADTVWQSHARSDDDFPG